MKKTKEKKGPLRMVELSGGLGDGISVQIPESYKVYYLEQLKGDGKKIEKYLLYGVVERPDGRFVGEFKGVVHERFW